jgi:6-pyruvoyltetrahydropterin/6-carboxytetrahydropterin synthase
MTKRRDKMVTVTRIFEFAYAHFLEGHKGKCCQLHGHNGILEVEVAPNTFGMLNSYNKQCKEGHLEPLENSMVMDFGDLKKVQEHVIEYLDHKCLNEIFCFHPTAENMCLWIVETLQQHPVGRVMRVRIWETRNSYAEWKRGD